MKRTLLIIGFILITLAGFTQTTTGWAQQRSKVNFKDSINIAKGWMIDGTIVLPSVTKINFLNDVTGLIQSQINLKANLASPTFTGTVTVPSPFTLGATSVTTSGTELNYLDNVTGTTGTGKLVLDNAPTITGHPTVEGVTATGATGTGNLVFSASPTLTGTVTLPTATSIGDVSSTEIGYVNGVTGAIQTQLDARKYMPYDFLIEEVAGTTYARPNPNTAYTATSNAVPSVVINSVMGQLTAGGIIQFAAGTFDNCDSIVVPYDNITWRGSGRNKTILKLKASFDAGKKVSDGFIQVIEKDYFTILDMEIDGNGANQTKIDDGGSAGLAIICGIETEDTQYTTIDNCYIHDFTETGVFSSGCDFLTIKNSHIKDNYWNGVTFGWGTDFNVVENCLVEGGGDVGVALYGRNNKILGSTIRYVTGTHGFDNSSVSVSLEVAGDGPYVRSQYHQIVNNMIKGAGQKAGIVSNAIGEGSLGVVISNNYIDSCGVAISMMGDSSLIANNKIVNPQGESYNYGIYIQDGDYNFVTGNDITCRTIGSGDYPILITNTSDGADYNKIVNNNLFGGTYYSIGVGHANCDGNYIAGNIFNDSQGGATDIYDVGTGTIKTYDNYDYNSARFNPVTTGANGIGITGGYAVSMATTGATSVTLPTSGTLAKIDSTMYTTSETFGTKKYDVDNELVEYYVYDVDGDGELEELAAAVVDSRSYLHGAIIYVAGGIYNITAPIEFTGENDFLTIKGNNAYLRVPAGYTQSALKFTASTGEGINDIRISGLNFRETHFGAAYNWNGIEINLSGNAYMQMSWFEDLFFSYVGNVIDVTLEDNGWFNANTFNDIHVEQFRKFLHQDRDFTTPSPYFDGNNFNNIQAQATAITTHFVDSVYMQYCNFSNCIFWDANTSDTAFLMTDLCIGNSIIGGSYGYSIIIDPDKRTTMTYLGGGNHSSIDTDTLTIGENLIHRGYGGYGPSLTYYNSYSSASPIFKMTHHGAISHTNFFGETLSTNEMVIGTLDPLKIGTYFSSAPVSLYINKLEKIKLYYSSPNYITDISTNVNISGRLDVAQISASLTDGTPTDAEIDAATGTTPAAATAGWKVTIKDSDGTGLLYLVESDGSNWFYVVMTKAL